MTTDYQTLHPAVYKSAAKLRADAIGQSVDKLYQDRPMLANAIVAFASDTLETIETACSNDARGTNVVPHLLATLDTLYAEIEGLSR